MYEICEVGLVNSVANYESEWDPMDPCICACVPDSKPGPYLSFSQVHSGTSMDIGIVIDCEGDPFFYHENQ